MKKLLAVSILTGVVTVLGAASAIAASTPSTWNQTVEVTSESVITLSSTAPDTVTLNADPTVNNGFGTVAVPLTVASNNASGYHLTLSMIASDTHSGALFDDGTSAPLTTSVVIPGISGTGTLTANQWGFTAATGTNTVPTSASTFTQVPASSSPATLVNTSAGGTSVVYVNFGSLIDYTLPSGITYANQVTYTASVNP